MYFYRFMQTTRKFTEQMKTLLVDILISRKDDDKAEVLAEHLETVFQANDMDINLNPIITHREGPAIKFCSPKEVRYIITKLKANKDPGHNMITARMLKELARKGMVLLTSTYNFIHTTFHLLSQRVEASENYRAT